MCVGLGWGRLDSLTGRNTYFEADEAQNAAAAIREEIGKPFNVTEIYIEEGKFRVLVQDPDNPKNLDEYKYIGGFVTGPNLVKLDGMNENLAKSSFPFDEINFATIPELAAQAVEKSGIKEVRIYRMTFQRGFAISETGMGSLGSAYWKIEIRGTRENVTVTANPQGKFLGIDLSQTSQARDFRLLTKENLQKAQDALKDNIGENRKISGISLNDKTLRCKIINLENPEVRDLYEYGINGITNKTLSKILTIEFPGHNSTFSLNDINLTDAANLVEKAKTRVDMPDAEVGNISIERKKPNFVDKDFQLIWSIFLKKGVNDAGVNYDDKGNEIYVKKNEKIIFRKK
ncbi:MAG: hypothetical protein ACR2MD_17770 [Aridibacter sp.]